jgi:hypothetical protein
MVVILIAFCAGAVIGISAGASLAAADVARLSSLRPEPVRKAAGLKRWRRD